MAADVSFCSLGLKAVGGEVGDCGFWMPEDLLEKRRIERKFGMIHEERERLNEASVAGVLSNHERRAIVKLSRLSKRLGE